MSFFLMIYGISYMYETMESERRKRDSDEMIKDYLQTKLKTNYVTDKMYNDLCCGICLEEFS